MGGAQHSRAQRGPRLRCAGPGGHASHVQCVAKRHCLWSGGAGEGHALGDPAKIINIHINSQLMRISNKSEATCASTRFSTKSTFLWHFVQIEFCISIASAVLRTKSRLIPSDPPWTMNMNETWSHSDFSHKWNVQEKQTLSLRRKQGKRKSLLVFIKTKHFVIK